MVKISWELVFNNYTEFSMNTSHGVPKGLSMVKLSWNLDFNFYSGFSM